MKNGRKSTDWDRIHLNVFKYIPLNTTRPIEEEVIASLSYLADVKDAGREFVRGHGHNRPERVYRLFQSYIRQARAFYESAQTLHYRASSLIYYYSFLNLVKAFISLHRPSSVLKRVNHGIYCKYKSGDFSKQTIKLQERKGVFHHFYELLFTHKFKIDFTMNMNIKNLFGYCTDISYDYESAGLGRRKMAGGMANILLNRPKNKAWITLAIENFQQLNEYKKFMAIFNSRFERVNLPKNTVREVFKIFANEYNAFWYFDSRSTTDLLPGQILPKGIMIKEAHEAIKNFSHSSVHDSRFDYYLSAPIRRNLQLPMTEPVAIYLIMFYLGSLVRYHPYYLEKLLESRDAWIIERFVKSTPGTFLRHMANRIRQKDYVYSRV